MTDEQLKVKAKNLVDTRFNELYVNNPMMMFNPNWAERLVEGIPYDRQTGAPIRRYVENYSKKFGRKSY